MTEDESVFVRCSCQGHAVEFTVDNEYNTIWLQFWHPGYYNEQGDLLDRLKMIWQLLTKGRIACDDFVFTKDGMCDLIERLKAVL